MSEGKICLECVRNLGKIYTHIFYKSTLSHLNTKEITGLFVYLNLVKLTSSMKLSLHTVSEGHNFPNDAITLMAKGIIFLLHEQKW